MNGSRAIVAVEAVNSGRQPGLPLGIACFEEIALFAFGQGEVGEHDAAFLEGEAGLEDAVEELQGRADQLRREIRRPRQRGAQHARVARHFGIETVRPSEDRQAPRHQALAPQLLPCPTHKAEQSLLDFRLIAEQRPKRPRDRDPLLCRQQQLQRQARDAIQLANDALADNCHFGANLPGVRPLQIKGRLDPLPREPGRPLPPDAPNITDIDAGQSIINVVCIDEIPDAAGLRRLLRQPVGDLGKGFRDTNADRDRDAGLLFYRAADCARVVGQAPALEAGEVQERLVDRINLKLRREFRQGVHDPAGHVAVERIIRAEHGDAMRKEIFFS